MKADQKTVNDTLASIARATDTHPTRLLARQKVAEFRLDREKGTGLPVATATSGSGARLLDRDAVVRASYPDHAQERRAVRRQFWLQRLLGW